MSAEEANPKSETQLRDDPTFCHRRTSKGFYRLGNVIHSVRIERRCAVLKPVRSKIPSKFST